MATIFTADLLATLVALPFFALGVIGFVVAVCVAMFGAMFFLHHYARCEACGKRVRVPASGHAPGS